MIQTYKDLNVYNKLYDLSIEIYRIAMNFPREELYGLTSQIKRAATSIPLNIAEGYGKKARTAEFKRYLMIANGSCNEMLVLLDMCRDLSFMSPKQHEEHTKRHDEAGKMIGGMLIKRQ